MSKRLSDRASLWLALCGTALLLGLAIWGWQLGLYRDLDTLQAFIDGLGAFAPVCFVLLHVAQVAVPVIPGAVLLTAGVLCFGPYEGFALNYAGILIGSTLAFLLARRCGTPLVRRFLSDRLCEKYLDSPLPPRFEWVFAALILLPFLPDDALCMVAGLTKMTLRRFVLIIAVAKPFSIALYSLSLLALGHIGF